MVDKNIVSYIKKDGIGVLPTDTLYGLVGSAFSKKAVKKIYTIKKRDTTKPLIILISKISDLKKFDISLTKVEKDLVKKVWPGKVSIIFSCSEKQFHYLHRGTKSLAFRLPQKKNLLVLLNKTGPLVAPSANPESLPPAETIEQAKKYFGSRINFYIDEGVKRGKPSKLIKIENNKIVRLR